MNKTPVASCPLINLDLSKRALSMTGQLRYMLTGYTRNWATTQDLIQDVHVRVLTTPLTSLVNPDGFVWRIAINIGIDWARRERRSRISFEYDIEKFQLDEIVDSPERRVMDQQAIERLIAKLTPRGRQALELIKGRGYSYEEAAGIMKVTKCTVETHLRNVLLSLRRARAIDKDL